MTIYNGADEPIFRCAVDILEWDWRNTERDKAPKVMRSLYYPTVGANASTTREEPGVDPPPRDASVEDIYPPLRITFTDGRGQRWTRDADFKLTRA